MIQKFLDALLARKLITTLGVWASAGIAYGFTEGFTIACGVGATLMIANGLHGASNGVVVASAGKRERLHGLDSDGFEWMDKAFSPGYSYLFDNIWHRW